jgi:hypothetical protein
MQNFIDIVRGIDLVSYRSGHTPQALVMAHHGHIAVTYAPFDHVNIDAELVLVGLTPGRTQAANALESLKSGLNAGLSQPAALRAAKMSASFSGSMRSSLISMLDRVGVPQKFGRQSAAEFFEVESGLTHFTSALRYPVYMAGGDNYSGSALTHPALRCMVETYLAEEARALPKAVWVPLGTHAEASLRHLADLNVIDGRRVLSGLPHPSGANAERIAYFLGRKLRTNLSTKTNAAKIDSARQRLTRQIAELAA